jgi:hypothetical protein
MGTRPALQLPAFALFALAGSAAAQVQPDSGAYVTTLGSDTVALERFVVTRLQLRVDALTRVPQTRLLHLIVDWDEAGQLKSYELDDEGAPGSRGPGTIRTVATVRGDSLHIEVTQSGSVRQRYLPFVADVPLISPLYSLYAVAIKRASEQRDPGIRMLGQQGLVQYATRWKADSLTLDAPGSGPLRVLLDAHGKMRMLDASATTFKVLVRATDWPDIEGLARQFARLDARGQSLGTLSPRDTARLREGGATISIEYGQPAARGRTIFGDLVPWDRVWRTGANAATQLDTNRDLVIGRTLVPAGRYTLWSIPGRRTWRLILNRQTGQWGTEYDSTLDLARILIETRQVRDPVERFTITIERQGVGGVIRMTWGRTQAIVPFTIR